MTNDMNHIPDIIDQEVSHWPIVLVANEDMDALPRDVNGTPMYQSPDGRYWPRVSSLIVIE